MALKLKLDLGTMPPWLKTVLVFVPAVILSALVVIFLIVPKNKEIKRLNAEITKQENQIAVDQVKAARLATLKVENEKLKKRLEELKLQLPEEKEISSLLKQVSDRAIQSGLKIVSWKPEAKKDHSSGIIYEIPVSVEMSGTFHALGVFYSNLTKLDRIVNISDIKIGDPKPQRDDATIKISFKATTFSGVPEQEATAKAGDTAADKSKGAKK